MTMNHGDDDFKEDSIITMTMMTEITGKAMTMVVTMTQMPMTLMPMTTHALSQTRY